MGVAESLSQEITGRRQPVFVHVDHSFWRTHIAATAESTIHPAEKLLVILSWLLFGISKVLVPSS